MYSISTKEHFVLLLLLLQSVWMVVAVVVLKGAVAAHYTTPHHTKAHVADSLRWRNEVLSKQQVSALLL